MKIFKVIRAAVMSLVVLLLSLILYGSFSVPDEICTTEDKRLDVGLLFTVESDQYAEKSLNREGSFNLQVRLFNAIPIKNTSVTVKKRSYVIPSGEVVGLSLYTNGLVIVSAQSIETENGSENPSEKAGLMKGDIITEVNSEKITSHLMFSRIIEESQGKELTVKFERDSKEYETKFTPSFSKTEGRYMAGLWVRDSAAGLGTLTFVDAQSSVFAGLGHAVCDIDSGDTLPVSYGNIFPAKISGCYKGKSGEAGELCGTFSGESIGVLVSNCELGVYGVLSEKKNSNEVPVAMKDEIRKGSAELLTQANSESVETYSIEIEKINPNDSENRDMVIKINDKNLIDKTGGIVQGMSGSPIIQNGRLIGAVTHVFVDDPTKGYAIFAEKMTDCVMKSFNVAM